MQEAENWQFIGLLPLFDPPRHDTKETIERCLEKGISVKMVTGDQLLIGKEVARQLGMGTNMYTTDVLIKVRDLVQGVKNRVKACVRGLSCSSARRSPATGLAHAIGASCLFVQLCAAPTLLSCCALKQVSSRNAMACRIWCPCTLLRPCQLH